MSATPLPATQQQPIDGRRAWPGKVRPAQAESTSSPRRLARIAGLLYLINAVVAGFAYGFVATRMYAAGDAAATAGNVLANLGLVRLGVVADLLQATEWIFLGMALYLLLQHVNPNAGRAMMVLVAIGAAIVCLNDVFEFVAARVATDGSYLAAFGAAGSNALVLLLLDLQHYGFLIAQIFFGLWLIPLGYLAYRSGMFPKALGVTIIVAGVCYLADMLVLFLVPDVGTQINAFLVIPPTIGEMWMAGYLLVKGVRSSPRDDRAPVADPAPLAA
jgi:Domain of unknown function (DUF4386)